jgi:hypothetical protein
MSSLVIDTLYLRKPPINYVSPPICALFSSTGFPVIVIEPIEKQLGPTGLQLGGVGNVQLSWDSYPGALCYSILTATDPTNPSSPYNIVSECVPENAIIVCSIGWFKVTAIVQAPGVPPVETPATTPVFNPGGDYLIIPLPQFPNTVGYNLYKNPVANAPNGTYTLMWGNFNGPQAEVCSTGCYEVQVITGEGPTPPSLPICTTYQQDIPGECPITSCIPGFFYFPDLCECLPCQLFTLPCPVGYDWNVEFCECTPGGGPPAPSCISFIDSLGAGATVSYISDVTPYGGVATGVDGNGYVFLYQANSVSDRTQIELPGSNGVSYSPGPIDFSPTCSSPDTDKHPTVFYWNNDSNAFLYSYHNGVTTEVNNDNSTFPLDTSGPFTASSLAALLAYQFQANANTYNDPTALQTIVWNNGPIQTIGGGGSISGGAIGYTPVAMGPSGHVALLQYPNSTFSLRNPDGSVVDTEYPFSDYTVFFNRNGDAVLLTGQGILYSGGTFTVFDAVGLNWTGINNSQLIVGFDGNNLPVTWDPVNGQQSLPLAPGATYGQPTGVNDDGVIVGNSDAGAWVYLNGTTQLLLSLVANPVNWNSLDSVVGITNENFVAGSGTFNSTGGTGFAAQLCP